MISRNDACWCGSGKKWKKCHYPLLNPESSFEEMKARYKKQYQIHLKTPEEIAGIRAASKLTAQILQQAAKMAKEGVTTNEINDFVMSCVKKANATSAALGYGEPPFPKGVCISLNDVICHGIPDDTPLKTGDILNVDLTCILNGFFGDASIMIEVGECSEIKRRVVQASHECLMNAIRILKPGVLIKEIGDVIEETAKKYRCTVVDQFVGHGVGMKMHEPPQVPHHYNNIQIPLVEGMVFTIEPMINAGQREAKIDPIDGWTARTVDGSPSAQWEHTIAITANGHEILTLP